MRMTALLMIALLPLSLPAAAQERAAAGRSVFDDYLNPTSGHGGFLSVPGLDFRSSVGFSYLSSGSHGSTGMGYYMGHFSYRFGSSLTLNWDVGVGSSLAGPDRTNDYRFFLPNVDLTYRPSDRFMMRLQFQQGGWGTPWMLDPRGR
ncbi:MAG: hypothetical protein PHQ19_08685 [Candidatus Krumholzibacteria bacterium]|nr:hypothetical protein [Candidatus Krumholzibacteria bacterium]